MTTAWTTFKHWSELSEAEQIAVMAAFPVTDQTCRWWRWDGPRLGWTWTIYRTGERS